METSVEIQNLSFSYKDQTNGKALDNISLNIDRGEFLMILGPSGAGKSTFAYCLNGIIPNMMRGSYEGAVILNGKEMAKQTVSHMARDIGLVFQDFENQLFSTNVRLEIAFSPENFSVPREEIDRTIDEMLKLTGLEGFDKREPATLSGGQKQRLVIGSVLAGCPKILCMDEPTTDLDPIGKIEVFNLAGRLRQSGEITLIVIEHETVEALHANRVLLMKDGNIFKLGPAEEVLGDVQAFYDCGLMPLQVPEFFHRYRGEKPNTLPLDPETGLEAFNRHSIVIHKDRHEELRRRDMEREQKYGDILIDVRDLSYTYPNGTPALNNASLQVREGEFLAIVGHNGSGKTTLVKHFNGLLKPTGGSAIVCGKDTSRHSIFELGRDVGFVFQNPDHQIFSENIYDEVVFSPRLRGVPEAELKERVTEALHAVDLDGYEQEDPFTKSKGIRQRIAVASVLSARPRVIILDEPTTGLDYTEQRKMMSLVRRLNEAGHTVIIITHTMWVVAEYAHRVAVMNGGKLIMYGSTREVFSDEATLRTHSLRTPHIVELSNKLGKTVLSLDEMLYCTEILQ
ncbi:MAG: energy-coupling factor transporter ATPase [Treponema sp.]|nr:energy-coupling factor transporter ATPase [Treponema sp.]